MAYCPSMWAEKASFMEFKTIGLWSRTGGNWAKLQWRIGGSQYHCHCDRGGTADSGGGPRTFSDPGGLPAAHSPGPRIDCQSLAIARD
jgi:hypothetical protein